MRWAGIVTLFWLATADAITLQWDAGANWPAGTTVEACLNAGCVSGISGNAQYFSTPPPGTVIDARARAIPPSGYQCGDPTATCQPSPWATLAQSVPYGQVGLWARYEASIEMASPTFVRTHADLFSTANVSSLTSGSWVVDGSDRLLLAGIASGAGSPVAPSAVRWGGSGGTALTKQGSTIGVGPYGDLSLYALVAPTAQTSTSYYLWPSAQDETVGGSILITGAHQTTPLGTVATATGSGDTDMTPSVSVSSAVDDLVVAICWMVDTAGDSRTITSNGGTTAYDAPIPAYEFFIIQTKVATSTTTSMDFTISGTANAAVSWGVIGVAVKPAASGADASISLSGAAGSSGIGALSLSGTATKTLSGNAASGAVGTVSTAVLLQLLGNAASGAIGTLTGSGAANKTLSGVSGATAIGTLTGAGAANKTLSGNAASGAIGTVALSGGSSLALSGVSVATAAGILSLSGAANVTLPGVFITAQTGNVAASAGGNVTVSLSGNAASGNVGALSLTGAAAQSLSGVSASGFIGALSPAVAKTLSGVSASGNAGTVALSANALLSLLGVSSSANSGVITVAAGGSITLSGVNASGLIGTVTASAGSPATITLSGAASIAAAGTLALSGDALVLLPGTHASGAAGNVRLTEIVTPGGRLLLVQSEDRLLVVKLDSRILLVGPDDSSLTIN